MSFKRIIKSIFPATGAWVFFVLLIIMPLSCTKDPSTEPTDLLLKFSLEQDQSPPNFVDIESSSATLKSFEFDGIREGKRDYYFKSDFDPPVRANLITGELKPEKKFNVPQGVYERIRVAVEMAEDTSAGIPGIVFSGSAQFPGRGRMPFEIKLSPDFNFEGNAKRASSHETSGLGLSAQKISTLEIVINTKDMFKGVPGHMIEEAERPVVNGKPTLVIGEDINNEIYGIVSFRLQQSAKAIIKQ